jgi:hypothetical protein
LHGVGMLGFGESYIALNEVDESSNKLTKWGCERFL